MKETPNLDYVRNLSGGDQEFEAKLIAILKQEFVKEKQLFLDYFEAENLSKAGDLVHKIKHKISLLGLQKSYEIAQNFEKELHQGRKNLYDKFVRILVIIDQYILEL